MLPDEKPTHRPKRSETTAGQVTFTYYTVLSILVLGFFASIGAAIYLSSHDRPDVAYIPGMIAFGFAAVAIIWHQRHN